MIGIFLLTHGALGEALIDTAIHVLGARPLQLDSLGLLSQDSPDALVALAKEKIAAIDTGEGVLVLSDILGASPANLACKLLSPPHIEGVFGLNLPMLLRALTYRHEAMASLLQKTLDGGLAGVCQMNHSE